MPYTPSTAAQTAATAAGNNQAALASPLTGLQSSIAGGNLAPAALIDGILSTLASVTWTTVSFTNSWTDYDNTTFPAASYTKDALGWVHVRGIVKLGTSGTSAFTLPAGYRPLKAMSTAQVCSGGVGEVQITAAGNVNVTNLTAGTNVSTWCYIMNIHFFAEQ